MSASLHLALLLLITAWDRCGLSVALSPPPPSPPPPRTSGNIIVPCYAYPGAAAWNTWQQGADVLIVDPSNGDFTTTDPAYVAKLRQLRNASASTAKTILGYIHVSYGNRNSTAVLANIASWYRLYGNNSIDGFFVDESPALWGPGTSQPLSDAAIIAMFKSYSAAIRAGNSSKLVVMNTGYVSQWQAQAKEFLDTAADSSGRPIADTIVTFEGTYANYVSAWNAAPWMVNGSYTKSRFANIVHDLPLASVQAALNRTKSSGAGFLYLTDASVYTVAPNSSVWSQEVTGLH